MTSRSSTSRAARARQATGGLAPLLVVVGAIALLVGGYEHLALYRQDYRFIPTIGPLFLVNVVASAIVGVTLLVRRDRLLRLAGLAIAGVTLVFFGLSRTAGGVFGFAEAGFDPAPQAAITVAAEVVALVALSTSLVLSLALGGRRGRARAADQDGRSFTQQ
jgi:hypothetical protein